MGRLEYLLVHSVSCCVVYLSAPSSHPWKPTSACSEIGFVFPGLLKPVNHRAFEGLTYFPAIGEMEHQSFWQLNTSPKKNFDSHTVKVRNTVPSLEQWIEVIRCLVINWSLVSLIPLPFDMLIAIFTLDHSFISFPLYFPFNLPYSGPGLLRLKGGRNIPSKRMDS